MIRPTVKKTKKALLFKTTLLARLLADTFKPVPDLGLPCRAQGSPVVKARVVDPGLCSGGFRDFCLFEARCLIHTTGFELNFVAR